MKNLKKTLPLAFAIVLAAGCASTDTDDSGFASDSSSDTGDTSTTAVNIDDGIRSDNADSSDYGLNDSSVISPALETIVYFAFDKATLMPESRALLNAHAEQIKANGGSIVLEGHADERGTREYNLALGERRALSVQNYLAIQGVSKSQMESVSFGEEKPVSYGAQETSWAKNRRVELRY